MAEAKDSKKAPARALARPDLATIVGLLLAVGGIVGGLLLEGGELREIVQPTAAIIVLGGTFGAVLVTTPLRVMMGSLGAMKDVFFDHSPPPEAVVEQLVEFATKARKHGIVSIEQEAEELADPFLKKALMLAVDGTDLQELRKMMELELDLEEHHAEAQAKVFESAGGYAPTIGIIGAVLGLIQVMKKLADIDEVGKGIAVAFVATIYGVGFANVFFLPAGTKIKAKAQRRAHLKELMLEGVIGIVEGMNPKLIRCKLEAFLRNEPRFKKAPPGRKEG